jgi:3-hydroxybutyryl-CoA dehydrogenase
MSTSQLSVIGAGTMGAGIAQIALEAGHRVNLVDTRKEFVDRGVATVRGFLERKVAKGKLTQEECEQVLSRLDGFTDMEKGVAGAVMVVEAVFESLELKQEIFSNLDRWCPPETILASNTSTLPISKIASATQRPEWVIGTHYFSPVPLMRLVEVVRGEHTSDAVADQDVPGFIVNRFLCLLYNEAANLIHNGVASAEDIDAALKLGCNWPMGVTEIMDMAGVDVTLLALKAMYEMTGEERYKPSPLLEKMVGENRLGRKTGEGFYEHG